MWQDNYQTRAACRNLMIDLLPTAGDPQPFEDAAITYTFAPSSP
jgi:hypothetical protein